MRKLVLITGGLALVLVAGFLVTKRPSRAQSSQAQVPDQVVYRHLFHHVAALKKKTEEVEKDGKDATQFRTYFQRNANLTDDEARALDEVSADYSQGEQLLIARAKPIVEAYKAQYPGGQVPHGQKPAPPPPELGAISQERDALALRAREQLRVRLVDDVFSRFDKFVKTRVIPNVPQAPAQ